MTTLGERALDLNVEPAREAYTEFVGNVANRTLVKWPTRQRPDLFLRQLPKWLADPSVTVLVTIDEDDLLCNNRRFIDAAIDGGRVAVIVSKSRSKVEAINHDLHWPWGFLIVAADDMTPQRPDYASHLRRILFDKWPDGDGVLHVNDGRVGPGLNTGAIMGRKWFDRFGYVYNPSYTSLWCDNELHAVAEGLGRQHYVEEVVIRHEWTNATGKDALHERNESFYEQDGLTFGARKLSGFPH